MTYENFFVYKYLFSVFHVRALYHTKTLITNKRTKRVLSSIVTQSYMFRPCWVIFRENFFVILILRLLFIVEWECAVDCVLRCFWRRGLSVDASRDRGEFTPPVHSTQSTAHSHSTIKCNLSVTITKRSPWRWPSRVETCRSVLRLMIKLFVHLLVISVFANSYSFLSYFIITYDLYRIRKLTVSQTAQRRMTGWLINTELEYTGVYLFTHSCSKIRIRQAFAK
jgi:hypothetical protein